MRYPLLIALASAAGVACGGPTARSDARPKEEAVPLMSVSAPQASPVADMAGRGLAGGTSRVAPASAAPPEVANEPPAPPPSSSVAVGASDTAPAASRMLIRMGVASIEVDSLERAVAQVRAIAARLGGIVGNASVQTGRDQVRSATLEVKVPVARFDDAVNGLSPIGHAETVNVTAEDVGEEYVDVSARVANSRRLETRLIALLDRSTGRLTDVLAVERELARVREEIDRAEGRLRYLRTQVALSTLTVTVHERAPIVGTSPTSSPIGDAFKDAWRNFVGFIAGLIAASGVLVPLGVLVAVGLWASRRWWKRPHMSVIDRGAQTDRAKPPVEPPSA